MPKKEREWPEPNELVIGKITKVNPFSAFVALEEYPGKEGMVHISEVARKWIKDIREFVKEGQPVVALVLNVEPAKGHIALSLKRVSDHEAEEKLKEYKREAKAEKMLAAAAKKLNVSLDVAYKQVGFKMRKDFGELFRAFQTVQENEAAFSAKGYPAEWIAAIKAVAETALAVKEVKLKGTLELKCPAPDGVEVIKNILTKLPSGITASYISAPKYMLTMKTRDAKTGEKALRSAAEAAIKSIQAAGGSGTFTAG
ncbi:MAG: translation initiation factor IF-2 subunit alpha [Candidatus Aenigmatarchaeota archaeon]|nr:translation initiation factor IF-2 subunit alpha [Candidatus Aenigmarchaeota archaeon]